MNFRISKALLPLVGVIVLGHADHVYADVAIIANPGFASDTANAEDVKRLFLGKSRDLAGTGATPVDQQSGSPVYESFYKSVVGKSASQLRAYWSRLVFTGKGKPPKALENDAEIVAAVASDVALIGYVDSRAVTGDVKVLLTIP